MLTETILNVIPEILKNILPEALNVLTGEVFFLCMAGLVFWCISKRAGVKIIFSFIIGGSVISIIQAVTGFSLPSYQVFVIALLGASLFINFSRGWLRFLCILIPVLAAGGLVFTGYTTIIAAGISVVAAVITSLGVTTYIDGTIFDRRQNLIYAAVMLIPVFVSVLVTLPLYFNDKLGLAFMSALINRSGLFTGLIVSWYIESTHINFSVKCENSGKQFLKFLLGCVTVCIFYYGLRAVSGLASGFWFGKFIVYLLTAAAGFAAFPVFIKHFLQRHTY